MPRGPMMTGEFVHDLDKKGFGIIRTRPTERAMSQTAKTLGDRLRMARAEVDGTGWLASSDLLRIDQLERPETPVYVGLGCLAPPRGGGALALYDGRLAGRSLISRHGALRGTRLTVAAGPTRSPRSKHSLMSFDQRHGTVLRYRSPLDGDVVDGPLPDDMDETRFHEVVGSAVREERVLVHNWNPGDFLVIDNRAMLHAFCPSTGGRGEFVGVRFSFRGM
ncbi:TauD/TfdA family dioxygenase [Salininema proteolyticum]|uniref:TauD/TfdA family dioxygenase n=1 Tax=Salininema proteolyticum TaxID=1607685 RepID=A0ABV8U3T3_9ACTN